MWQWQCRMHINSLFCQEQPRRRFTFVADGPSAERAGLFMTIGFPHCLRFHRCCSLPPWPWCTCDAKTWQGRAHDPSLVNMEARSSFLIGMIVQPAATLAASFARHGKKCDPASTFQSPHEHERLGPNRPTGRRLTTALHYTAGSSSDTFQNGPLVPDLDHNASRLHQGR